MKSRFITTSISLIVIIALIGTNTVFGRFISVDPEADKYPCVSPYVYTLDNPLKYNDPDGRMPWLVAAAAAALAYTLFSYEEAQTPTNESDIIVPTTGEKVLRQAGAVGTALTVGSMVSRMGLSAVSTRSGAVAANTAKNTQQLIPGPRGGKSWSTARRNYWKGEAKNNPGRFTTENLDRTKKGLAPQRRNPNTGKMESRELHHNKAQRDGGVHSRDNLEEGWPDDHAKKDPFRRVKKDKE